MILRNFSLILTNRSTAMTWSIACLCKNPQEQEKVLKEVDEVMGKTSKTLTLQELGNLQYLTMAFKESMRVHPPVMGVSRTAIHATEIDGKELPPNVQISLGIAAVQRNEKYWPEPEKFNPENFRPNGPCADSANKAFCPFSLGPRK
jgi:cytochrome P450